MAKGFVVVDMPEDCAHCSYADSDNKNWYCRLNKKDNDDHVLRATKPSWCQIQGLPKRKPGTEKYQNDFEKGWNACMNEILN